MKTFPCIVAWMGALMLPSPLLAATVPGNGLEEIPDTELGQMRGRYTVAGNTVAWFGVTMVSRWQSSAGQVIQGQMQLGMDFRKGGTPQVSFTPSITIASADTADVVPAHDSSRSVDSSGLANVSGLTQSVQVAGDGNTAWNSAALRVHDNGEGITADGSWQPDASQQQGLASAHVGFDGQRASVTLQIEGYGAVQQWIHSGSVGQLIALTGDGQQVHNQLQLDLVRQSVASHAPLGQNVAQAIALARGL